MAKLNFDDVWKEVSETDFGNNEPENDCDIKVIRRIYSVLLEAVELLNGPARLSPERRIALTTQVGKLRQRLHESSILVNRIDPTVPIYRGGFS